MATLPIKKQIPRVPPELRKKYSARTVVLNVYALMSILSVAIVFLCFLYLSAFNDISSQGVVISDLERDRARLIIENEVWNMRIARLKSLDVIEQQDVVKRMPGINSDEIEFVSLDQIAAQDN